MLTSKSIDIVVLIKRIYLESLVTGEKISFSKEYYKLISEVRNKKIEEILDAKDKDK